MNYERKGWELGDEPRLDLGPLLNQLWPGSDRQGGWSRWGNLCDLFFRLFILPLLKLCGDKSQNRLLRPFQGNIFSYYIYDLIYTYHFFYTVSFTSRPT